MKKHMLDNAVWVWPHRACIWKNMFRIWDYSNLTSDWSDTGTWTPFSTWTRTQEKINFKVEMRFDQETSTKLDAWTSKGSAVALGAWASEALQSQHEAEAQVPETLHLFKTTSSRLYQKSAPLPRPYKPYSLGEQIPSRSRDLRPQLTLRARSWRGFGGSSNHNLPQQHPSSIRQIFR